MLDGPLNRLVWLIAGGLLFALAVGLLFGGDAEPVGTDFTEQPVVAYLDDKVKIYRYDNGVDRCYVAVAYLHGWNIDIECRFGEGRVHE